MPLPSLNVAVGIAALVAPALHSLTDAMEWRHAGFSTTQLWLNYIAFLPMPWLLLGLYSAHDTTAERGRPHGSDSLRGGIHVLCPYLALCAGRADFPRTRPCGLGLAALYTVHGTLMVRRRPHVCMVSVAGGLAAQGCLAALRSGPHLEFSARSSTRARPPANYWQRGPKPGPHGDGICNPVQPATNRDLTRRSSGRAGTPLVSRVHQRGPPVSRIRQGSRPAMSRTAAVLAFSLLLLASMAFWPQYLSRNWAAIDRYTHAHAFLGPCGSSS